MYINFTSILTRAYIYGMLQEVANGGL